MLASEGALRRRYAIDYSAVDLQIAQSRRPVSRSGTPLGRVVIIDIGNGVFALFAQVNRTPLRDMLDDADSVGQFRRRVSLMRLGGQLRHELSEIVAGRPR